MRILLIYPSITVYSDDATSPQVRPPLGLLYIAAVAEKAGHEVEILDCIASGYGMSERLEDTGTRFGLSPDDIAAKVDSYRPDMVGISSMFTAFSKDSHDAAAAVKSVAPTLPVIFGGMHASTLPEEVLKDTNVDIIVNGEGEATFAEILESFSKEGALHEIAGLAFAGPSGEVKFSPPRERIKEIDDIPRPARHLVDLAFYSSVAEDEPDNYIMRHPYTTVYTSRGCPKKCVFCAAHNVWQNRWTGRSTEDVLDEIQSLIDDYGIREIHFLNDNVSVNRKRFQAICRGIVERGIDITWACPTGLAIWNMDVETLLLMKKAGCYKVCFGIETGTQELQQYIRKKLDLDRAKELMYEASRLGFWIQSTFILGFPYETREEIEATIEYAVSTRSDFVNFLLLMPYPGTEVYETMRNEGLLPEHAWDYKNFGNMMSGFRTLCRNRNLSAEELNELFNLAFRILLRRRIRQFILNPVILLRKIRSFDGLKFFLRILSNFVGVAKVVFLTGVTHSGTLKPVFSEIARQEGCGQKCMDGEVGISTGNPGNKLTSAVQEVSDTHD